MAKDPSVYVHEGALCESDDVGPRTRIWAFSHVMKGARVGADCNISGGVFIETGAVIGDRVKVKNGVQIWERVTLEDDVFVGPNATFTNDPNPRSPFPRDELVPTLVRRGATIGANATVIGGVTIGESAFVGAGAVVTRDVPAHGLVLGNPGIRVGWSCLCGQRLADDHVCHCGRRYRLISEDRGLTLID